MAYAFPPFYLIGRCLRKVREEKASLVLIALIWRSQPCYPILLELLIDLPLILPEDPMLLMDLFSNPHPLVVSGQLQLATWKLSGTGSLQQEFQQKLPSCWLLDGAQEQIQHIKAPGNNGVAGVLKGKLIHFCVPPTLS